MAQNISGPSPLCVGFCWVGLTGKGQEERRGRWPDKGGRTCSVQVRGAVRRRGSGRPAGRNGPGRRSVGCTRCPGARSRAPSRSRPSGTAAGSELRGWCGRGHSARPARRRARPGCVRPAVRDARQDPHHAPGADHVCGARQRPRGDVPGAGCTRDTGMVAHQGRPSAATARPPGPRPGRTALSLPGQARSSMEPRPGIPGGGSCLRRG